MAVARKSQHILLGDVGETFDGVIISVGDSSQLDQPRPVQITIGTDGVLFALRDGMFVPTVPLDQWPGVVPYVSGEVYFVPWDAVRGIDTEVKDEGYGVLTLQHIDGASTLFTLATLGAPSRFLDECRGLSRGSRDLVRDKALLDSISFILTQVPLLSEVEILHALHEVGWLECSRSTLEEILWDEHSPTFFLAHMWFVDEDADLESVPADPLSRQVLEILETEPASAEEICELLDLEGIDAADVYDVLYDPRLPTIKRARAWYVQDTQ